MIAISLSVEEKTNLLFSLSYVNVPFGKYINKKLGEVPTKYLDSEVSGWDRTLFTRQCECALDVAWQLIQSASRLAQVEIPSHSTLNDLIDVMFTEDGEIITPIMCFCIDSQMRKEILQHCYNGISVSDLKTQMHITRKTDSRFNDCMARLNKEGIFEICHDVVIDLRAMKNQPSA